MAEVAFHPGFRWLLLGCTLALCPRYARADGGAIRFSEIKAGYRITVFTSPTPFRAGPVDVSVFVQDAVTGTLAPDVSVTVRASSRGRPEESMSYSATTDAATNKLFRAALFDLPESGWWKLEVVIEGARPPVQVQFEVEAAAAPPRWLALWPWLACPVLVIVLYAIHQVLKWIRAGSVSDG